MTSAPVGQGHGHGVAEGGDALARRGDCSFLRLRRDDARPDDIERFRGVGKKK